MVTAAVRTLRLALFAFAALVASTSVAAELSAAASNARVPAFSTYAVARVSELVVSRLDLGVDGRARKFHSQLAKAVGRRANFAGHYVVVTWGCGTSCQAVATVDVETGAARLAPFSTSLGSEFRVNSRLFIDSPLAAVRTMDAPDLFHTAYYVWNEGKKAFELLQEPK